MIAALNPYHDLTFGAFIFQFFARCWALLTGEIGWGQLASDEIQVFVLAAVQPPRHWLDVSSF